MWTVLFIDEAATERLSLPVTERNALLHAVEKLEAFGPLLGLAFLTRAPYRGSPD